MAPVTFSRTFSMKFDTLRPHFSTPQHGHPPQLAAHALKPALSAMDTDEQLAADEARRTRFIVIYGTRFIATATTHLLRTLAT